MKLPSLTPNYVPLSAGTHSAVCFQVLDFGTQEDLYEGKTTIKPKIWLGFEVPSELKSDGEPFVIGREYTFSSSERSTFRKHLQAWRGKPFEDSDFGPEGSFDVENLIGVGCLISVEHNKNERAVITSIMAMPKGAVAPVAKTPRSFLDMSGSFDVEVYNSLPEWMQERIAQSPEFREAAPALAGSAASEADDATPF